MCVNGLVRVCCWAAPPGRGVHALMVSVLLQVNFTMSEDTTLGDLLQLNLHKFEDEVHGIVDKAMKESGMEKVNGVRSLPFFAQSPAAMLWLLARLPAPEGSAAQHPWSLCPGGGTAAAALPFCGARTRHHGVQLVSHSPSADAECPGHYLGDDAI